MTDFTKDELKIIYTCTELYKSGSGIAWPKVCSKKQYSALQSKIQSMIDNYCEHKNKTVGTDPTDGEGVCVYCIDCKTIIGEVY